MAVVAGSDDAVSFGVNVGAVDAGAAPMSAVLSSVLSKFCNVEAA